MFDFQIILCNSSIFVDSRQRCFYNFRVYDNLFQCQPFTSTGGPLSLLQKKVESGLLQPDEHQLKIAERLENLYQQVQTYEPKKQQTSSGGFSWFSFGKKDEKTPKEIPAALKGLYIYGSVGGGKTMLMDFFFDSCVQVVHRNS